MPSDKQIYSLRIPSDLRKQLEKLAALDDRSLNYFIVKVLTEYVKKQK